MDAHGQAATERMAVALALVKARMGNKTAQQLAARAQSAEQALQHLTSCLPLLASALAEKQQVESQQSQVQSQRGKSAAKSKVGARGTDPTSASASALQQAVLQAIHGVSINTQHGALGPDKKGPLSSSAAALDSRMVGLHGVSRAAQQADDAAGFSLPGAEQLEQRAAALGRLLHAARAVQLAGAVIKAQDQGGAESGAGISTHGGAASASEGAQKEAAGLVGGWNSRRGKGAGGSEVKMEVTQGPAPAPPSIPWTATNTENVTALCSQPPHVTVITFVAETLLALPPSALRQAYMEHAAALLSTALLNSSMGAWRMGGIAAMQSPGPTSMAQRVQEDTRQLLQDILCEATGLPQSGPDQARSGNTSQLQASAAHAHAATAPDPSRHAAAHAFLQAALEQPSLGQVLLLVCTQALERAACALAGLPAALVSAATSSQQAAPPAAAQTSAADSLSQGLPAASFSPASGSVPQVLQAAAAQHQACKGVVGLLGACIARLPAWVATWQPADCKEAAQVGKGLGVQVGGSATGAVQAAQKQSALAEVDGPEMELVSDY